MKYWRYALFVKEGALVEGFVGKDGLLIKVPKEFPMEAYPRKGNSWYFNESFDREIASQEGEWIVANPQLAWRGGWEIMS